MSRQHIHLAGLIARAKTIHDGVSLFDDAEERDEIRAVARLAMADLESAMERMEELRGLVRPR